MEVTLFRALLFVLFVGAAESSREVITYVKCRRGLRPDDRGGCIDEDECRRPMQCGTHGNCINYIGSYSCVCSPGYELNKFHRCVDENECESGRHLCTIHENCSNLVGGYNCVCKAGFVRDSKIGCRKIGSRYQYEPYYPPEHFEQEENIGSGESGHGPDSEHH